MADTNVKQNAKQKHKFKVSVGTRLLPDGKVAVRIKSENSLGGYITEFEIEDFLQKTGLARFVEYKKGWRWLKTILQSNLPTAES